MIALAALATALSLAPAWAHQRAGTNAAGTDAGKAAVARERAQVKHLEHAVAGQEAGSQTAAKRLQEKNARIAELQRQLQAAQAASGASQTGR